MSDLAARLVWIVMMTFVVAIIYGLFVTTMDFTRPNYNPASSGHRAATNVYGLFGTVSEEIKRNDEEKQVHTTSVAYKIARPYAITADLSAFLSGKLEIKLVNVFHHSEKQV